MLKLRALRFSRVRDYAVLWCIRLDGFVRRKTVLTVIFSLSLIYCIVNFLNEPETIRRIKKKDLYPIERTLEHFKWNTGIDNNVTEECSHTVYGWMFVTDEKGYICEQKHVLPNGCCDSEHPDTLRYSCATCTEIGCCKIYENCVSCCLNPDMRPILENVMRKSKGGIRILLYSVKNQFELCLAKCRTSSLSVYHENRYRNPNLKHCYTNAQPDIVDSDVAH